LQFAYDEWPWLDMIRFVDHIESNVWTMAANMQADRGSILKGCAFSNRTTSVRYLAAMLGRHLTHVVGCRHAILLALHSAFQIKVVR
jgi:hypothetical protein